MRDVITAALTDAAGALAALMADDVALGNIEKGAEAMANTLRQGGRVLSCGNGGSLCEASHFAEELTGRFRRDRRPLAAMAINDPGHMTCVANDIGFDEVFARGVEAHGRRGDTLLAISTSGRSANVIKAATRARESGMVVVAVTGKRGSLLAEIADIEICTPAGPFSDRVQ
ncbi:MAG: SIS domain-containing protein, partial [Acidobacteriota bacterium]